MQHQPVIRLRGVASLNSTQRINLARPASRHTGLIRIRNNEAPPLTERDILNAVYGQEFEMVYQGCHDLLTRKIVGIEAMIRWNHPTRGLILPGEFIGLAERSANPELINGIWDFVLNESLAQLQAWRDTGTVAPDTTMALNVSSAQIENDDGFLLRSIGDTLSTLALPSSILELEFSRSMPVSTCRRTAGVFSELSGNGIKLALDDFGMGSFDLRQVIDGHIDVIKTDRSLVRQMTLSRRHQTIARSLVDLFKSLGSRVVIEGVETAAQAAVVAEFGADYGQGYFFSRPVGAAAYAAC